MIYRVWPMTTKNKNRLVVVRDGKYMYIYDCILEEIGWSEVQIIWFKKKILQYMYSRVSCSVTLTSKW